MAYFRTPRLNVSKTLQAYAIGLAIGDGNLSKPSPRATRLRITCDLKYPNLINKISDTFKNLFPDNKISYVKRKGCVDISVYSNQLEKLLGWNVADGPKFIQKVSIPSWIKKDKKYLTNCLRGLIETDGSIYTDRKYKMVIFSTLIRELANDVYSGIVRLGFNPHIYNIPQKQNRFGLVCKYQVRLSKHVKEFLKLVRPSKT